MVKKISDTEREAIIAELRGGRRPIDVQKQFNISKQSLYTIKNSAPTPTSSSNNKPKELSPEEIQHQMYDPTNMKEYVEKEAVEENAPHQKIPKSLINLANNKLKEKQQKTNLNNKPENNQNIEVNDEEDKKVIINKIRQYVFAFESNKYISDYVGKDIDKYVLSLNNKSMKDLNNILEYIKFHIRNKGNNDAMIENALTALMFVVEKVGSRVGLEFDGLAKDIADDLKDPSSDLKRSITELSIEMNIASYFSSPKYDLLMGISQKLLFTHAKNKQFKKLEPKTNLPTPQPQKSAEAYLKSSMDSKLQEKYQDL